MKSQEAVYSFSAGVMSPRTSMRADLERFASAMSQCDNWIVTPQGGIQMREGFEQMALSSDPTNDSRMFQFHEGGTVSDIIVNVTWGNSLVSYYRDGALLSTTTHDFVESEFEELSFTNTEDYAVITYVEKPPYIIKESYDGTIEGNHINANQVPLVTYNDDKSPSEPTNVQARAFQLIFGPSLAEWKDGDPYYMRYGPGSETNEPLETFYFTNLANMIDDIEATLRQSQYLASPETTISVVSPGSPGLIFDIIITGRGNTYDLRAGTIFREGSDTGRTLEGSSVNNNPQQASTEPAWSYPFTVLHNGVYYQCIQPHFSEADTEPGVGASWTNYWVDIGAGLPTYFDWQFPNGSDWNLDAYYGVWDRGFPAVATFRQQRLLLMAAKDSGTGVWGSRIGDYSWFTLGPETNDALYFDIDTSDSPRIKWAKSQRHLVMGTSSGDYAVAAQITLAPGDVQAERQNAARSHATGAVMINTEIFYIEQGRERMRMTRFDEQLRAQTSEVASDIAENLLYERIKRITLTETPQPIIYGLRADLNGTLVAYTHPGEGIGAWFEFSSQGRIIDICAGYTTTTDTDELWALITYDGVDRYIEKMPYPARLKITRKTETQPTLVEQGIVLLDGWIQGTIDLGDNNVVTGLEKFDGLTVACLVDDAWTGEYLVTDGSILLQSPDPDDVEPYSGTYAVGMAYLAQAGTFEVASGNQNGTALGTKRRWNKLFCRILDSTLPVINGTLPPDRTPATEMGIPEILRDGLQDLIIRNVGWDNGSVSIVQNRPYPTHVLGLFGQFSSNNS